MAIKSINPVNGELIKSYKEDSQKIVNEKIQDAADMWEKWRRVSFSKKAKLMNAAARVLRKEKNKLAELMATEVGKPLKDGVSEVEKCAAVCEYYAKNAETFLKDVEVKTEAVKSYYTYQPLGVVLAIMPWNFPFWQSFRFLAPGLMAGNCGLLKHASNVPGCALAIENILLKAGFPKGVFQTLMVGSKAVEKIIENPVIKAVTLTGSTGAGKKVAQKAGECLKKTVLELGGSDPYLILEDADLTKAAELCASSRLINNGQSCISAKRFIVVEKVAKEFTQLLKEKIASKITGNPMEKGVDLGPMARADLRDELHQQVLQNIKLGAKCILGGEIPKMKGKHAFYTPTILTGVKQGMPGYDDEMFGPVASVITVKNNAEAIKVANDTVFGLGAAVFTKNIKEGERIAKEEIQAGACFVNGFVKSDPRLPFGGINQSGYGRELGMIGITEFVNIKTVVV